jgi:hypothetical protein
MSTEIKIEAALAELEAGKFSFRMVDAIKTHVAQLECELDVIRGLHASAIHELNLQEYANWRLERDLKRSNAKIYALLQANMVTERAYRKMAPIAIELRYYVDASVKAIRAALERGVTDLKSGKLQSRLADDTSKLYELLKNHAPTEETSREMQAWVIKIGEYIQVFKKRASATVLSATAYLSSLRKMSNCTPPTSLTNTRRADKAARE